MGNGTTKTWEEVVWNLLEEVAVDDLDPAYTYCFELQTPWNQVVQYRAEPVLSLLTAFHNQNGHELSEIYLDSAAMNLDVRRPERFHFESLNAAQAHLEAHEDATFEGFVFRDRNGLRLKVKSARYLALHRLKGNGNVFLEKNLLPLILSGETDELLTYFPEAAPKVFDVTERLEGAKARMLAVWERARGKASQKDFAIYVNKHTNLSSILFNARKMKVEPASLWKDSEEVLLKKLFLEA
jgi:hypothetical protein